jgi:heme/copper-type cytochrome/quinol oxidase subunit 2
MSLANRLASGVMTSMVILATVGCGVGTPDAGPASASAAPVTVTVHVSGRTVRTPSRRVTVRRGRVVRIVLTSDTAEEFHLHGYDRELELKPGVPAELRFVADQPGVFEAELHRSGVRAFELKVD